MSGTITLRFRWKKMLKITSKSSDQSQSSILGSLTQLYSYATNGSRQHFVLSFVLYRGSDYFTTVNSLQCLFRIEGSPVLELRVDLLISIFSFFSSSMD